MRSITVLITLGIGLLRKLWHRRGSHSAEQEVITDNMAKNGKCPTRMLSDGPADCDGFGAQSHDAVATAIADLIKTEHKTTIEGSRSDERGARCIALEGNWGSGKSTIIRLLRAKLGCPTAKVSEQDKCAVVVFDAWAHQGDSLRRSFLETLIGAVRKWITNEKWESNDRKLGWYERKEQLGKRVRKVEKTSRPVMTRGGKCFAGLLMFAFPVGLALLNAGLRDDLTVWFLGSELAGKVNLGLLLVLSPLFFLAVRQLLGWFRLLCQLIGRGNCAKEKTSADEKRTPGDIGSWLIQKWTTTDTEHVTESPDPTSLEFQNTFQDLMRDVIPSKSHRLIVIVVDNLDRVEQKDALRIWSTMQTFLSQSEHSWQDWQKRLWVVVPYDRAGLERLCQKNAANAQCALEESSPAQHFFDKTFQIRFDVPPLVASDWRACLTESLEKAFPEHDKDDDFYNIGRLFALHRKKNEPPPTPREIKIFVNQIGALHRRWDCSEIPLLHMAEYVIRRRSESVGDIIESLQTNDAPTDDPISKLLGERRRETLACLASGSEHGLQHVLEDRVNQAFVKGDGQALKELAGQVGFWHFLEAFDLCAFVKGDVESLSALARAFDDSGVLASNEHPETEAVLDKLRAATLSISSWYLDSETTEGCVALLNLLPELRIANHILKNIRASAISLTDETTDASADASGAADWVQHLLRLLNKIDQIRCQDAYADGVMPPSNGPFYVAACGALVEQNEDGSRWHLLRYCDYDQIVAHLAARAESGFDAGDLACIKVMKATKASVVWDRLAEALRARLHTGDRVPTPEVAILLESLYELSGLTDATDVVLRDPTTHGYVLHDLHRAEIDQMDDVLAWCAFTYIRQSPDMRIEPAIGHSAAARVQLIEWLKKPGERLVNAFTGLTTRLDRIDVLFNLFQQYPQSQPFVVSVLHGAVDPSTVGASKIAPQVADWLRSLDLDHWRTAIMSESELLVLALDVAAIAAPLDLGNVFLCVLLEHAEAVLNGKAEPDRLLDRWNEIPDLIADNERQSFRDGLRDYMIQFSPYIPQMFFKLYGNETAQDANLLKDERTLFDLFLPLIKKRGSKIALQWINSVIRNDGQFASSNRVFKKAIKTDLGKNKTKLNEEVQAIYDALS